MRLFRLIKIASLLKSKRSSFELSDYISPSFIKLVKLLFKIVFVAHLLACFWFFVNECEPIKYEDKTNIVIPNVNNSWEEVS